MQTGKCAKNSFQSNTCWEESIFKWNTGPQILRCNNGMVVEQQGSNLNEGEWLQDEKGFLV